MSETLPPQSPSSPPPAPKPNLRKIHKMRVAEIRDYTPRIRELFLKCEDPAQFPFRCGQFVMLHVPAEPKPLLRAYSVASGEQSKDGFRLVFNFVENGPGSKYVWAMNQGDLLDFTGPFGRLFFQEPPTEQLIFLNTGSGISQHVSYIESQVEKYPNLRYRLLFGVRSEGDMYYQAELNQLKSKLKDFQWEFVLSRPSPEWKGKKGYVQNFIGEFGYHQTPSTFYLCGNGGMIKEVKHKLQEEGFAMGQVFAEAFD